MSGDPGKYDAIFSQDPQGGQQPLTGQQQIGHLLFEAGSSKAQEAQGFWENTKWQGAAALKTFGDGFANVAGLLYKGGSAGISAVTGNGLSAGWNAASTDLQNRYGTSNPSILDLWGPESLFGKDQGREADEWIQKRLGNSAAFGESIGMLASFALPGGPVGDAAQATVRPMASILERTLAKAALKRAGVTGEMAGNIMDAGKAWEYLAANPGMAKNLSTFDSMLRFAGKNSEQVLTATADAMARSYAISPDSERMHALKTAALMTPLMLPVAKLGQFMGRAVMQMGMDEAAVAKLSNAYSRFQAGEMGLKELRQAMAEEVGLGWRAANKIITGGIEGTAFMAMMPGSFDLWTRARAGDPDASAQLTAAWLGNVFGTVAMHGVAGQDPSQIPFFRQTNPKLNKLETYLEAEAVRRTLEGRKQAEEAQRNADADAGLAPESSARQAMAEASAATQAQTEEALKSGGVLDNREFLGELVNRQAMQPDELSVSREEVRKQFAWASDQSQPMLRGNWRPEFMDDGSVWMQYGRDHSVIMKQDGSIELGPGVEDVMRDVGVAPDPSSPNREVLSVGRVLLHGHMAKKALDDLAMIGALRRMQGEALFQKLGYGELEPGVWVDGDGILHQANLDGSTVSRIAEGEWQGREDMRVVGRGDEPPIWSSPAQEQLLAWVLQKRAIAPDPLVDSMMLAAIDAASYGNSHGANELRRFLDGVDPNAMTSLGPGSDRELAMLLGSLASGNGNAAEAAPLFQAIAEHRAAASREGYMAAMESGSQGNAEAMAARAEREGSEAQAAARADRAKPIDVTDYETTFPSRSPEEFRTDLADIASGANLQGESGPVPITDRQARSLLRVVPKNSKLGKRLQTAAEAGPKSEVSFPANDFVRLTREWQKFSVPKSDLTGEELAAYRSNAESGDAALKLVATKFGLATRRSLADLMRAGERATKPEPKVAEMGGASDPISAIARAVWSAIRSPRGRRAGQRAADAFTKQSDVVGRLTEKSDPTLASDAREAMSGIKPRLEGEAKARFQAARDALKRLNAAVRDTPAKKISGALLGRHSWAGEMVDVGDGAQRARWELLVDGRVEPRNADEKTFRDSVQEGLKYLWAEAVKAGKTRREWDSESKSTVINALKMRDSSVVPFIGGKDVDTVMGSDDLRKGWFDWLAKHNPDVTVKQENGPPKQITGADLEAEYRDAVKNEVGGPNATSTEVLSALDFQRRFKNNPHIWEGYEMRDPNPLHVMEKQASRQAAEIAVNKVFGEDYSDTERKAAIERLKLDPEAAAAVQQLSTKPGLVNRAGKAAAEITGLGSEEYNKAMRGYVMEFAKRVGGGEPIRASKALTWLDPIERIARPVSVWRSFVLDMPEMVTQPLAYARFSDLRRGIGMMAENKGHAIALMRQQGAIENWMAEHVFGEASHVWSKITDFVSTLGTLTETGKQALFGYVGKAMLERWASGPSSRGAGDVFLLEKTMGYKPAEAQKLLSGDAPSSLKDQFVREFVQLLASRRAPAEGSRFAADPNVNRLFRYVRWATNRMTDTLTSARNVYTSIRDHGIASKPAAQAAAQSLRMLGLRAIGGLAGQALAYAMLDAMRGDNGFARWWRELTASPTSMVLKSILAQSVGGPAFQFAQAAWSGDPRQTLQMVPAVNIPYTVSSKAFEVVKAFWSGDAAKGRNLAADFPVGVANDIGILPKAESAAIMAALAGQTADRALSLRASEFERAEGIKHPMGDRYRPQEYYDAIDKIYREARNAPSTEEALKGVASQLRSALQMAPEESVAASIEGHQRMKHWTNEQRAKFIETHGDRVFAEMAQQDAALRDFAKQVRKMEGTNPTQFEAELDSVRKQAAQGAGDRWRPLAERAMEEATQRILAGDGMGEEIDKFAEALALYPEQAGTIFDPRVMRFLTSDGPDSQAKARRISAALKKRARDRAKEARIEKNREALRGQ